jgi:D-alanine-D-alanine ligase
MPVMSSRFGKVAVLCGGHSAEREVSMMSGQGVLDALEEKGVSAFAFDPAEQPMEDLRCLGAERAFVALHGRYGEDGAVQGALELLKIPYTGSGVMASALAMDKAMTKRIWSTWGIPTPRFMPVDAASLPDDVVETVGLPMVVKPLREGSSLGMTRVSEPEHIRSAITLATRFDRQALAEAFVEGRELTVALLGGTPGQPVRALPIVEIVAPESGYDYQNKYFTDVVRYHCPADLPAAVTQQIQDLACKAFEAIGCEGWARADVLWKAGQPPMFLEINTSPGMTSHSLVPIAARANGMNYADLCLEILSGARLKLSAVGAGS